MHNHINDIDASENLSNDGISLTPLTRFTKHCIQHTSARPPSPMGRLAFELHLTQCAHMAMGQASNTNENIVAHS